jgi:hypothetical protein
MSEMITVGAGPADISLAAEGNNWVSLAWFTHIDKGQRIQIPVL